VNFDRIGAKIRFWNAELCGMSIQMPNDGLFFLVLQKKTVPFLILLWYNQQ